MIEILFFRSIQNHIPIRIIVRIILVSQVVPNVVSITSSGDTSNRHVCTASIIKLDANTAMTPKPIIFENFALNESWINPIWSPNLVCLVDQIAIDAITPPKTIVWPTKPGKRAIDSGINVVSDCSCDSSNDESICTSPTPKIIAAWTKWPSTFDNTLLAIVYTPSSNGGVVTTSDDSSLLYAVSWLSICLPLES